MPLLAAICLPTSMYRCGEKARLSTSAVLIGFSASAIACQCVIRVQSRCKQGTISVQSVLISYSARAIACFCRLVRTRSKGQLIAAPNAPANSPPNRSPSVRPSLPPQRGHAEPDQRARTHQRRGLARAGGGLA